MPEINDNEKPIINISNLEMPINIQNDLSGINSYINDTNKSTNAINNVDTRCRYK